MAIISHNPATNETMKEFEELTDAQIMAKIAKAELAYRTWRKTTFSIRSEKMRRYAQIFLEKKSELAELATKEMGKPIIQAEAEIEKCAWAMNYYADHAEEQLSPQSIPTEQNRESYVRFDPLGIVLAVMPWNFPYWQAIRAIAPNLMAGNALVLKHASNVPQVALKLEELALEAGFPEGLMTTLLIGSKKVESVIADKRIVGVTLTGSENAGIQVAQAAGQNLKPSVLELGGMDPFIVLNDADLEITVEQAVISRLQNNGQSCIAAKRFILEEKIAEEFLESFVKKFAAYKIGDPLDRETQIGPLVNLSALEEIHNFVEDAKSKGASILTGGSRVGETGFFYRPTVVFDINSKMKISSQEVFGPVASVFTFTSFEDALSIANNTDYGLGASIWTKDIDKAKKVAADIETGTVAINKIVHSNPFLPFGGIKKSGYGRELSEFGIREFVNIKTVMVN